MRRNNIIFTILIVAGLFLLGTVSAASAASTTTNSTAPVINSFYPRSSATGVSLTNTPYAKFNKNITAGAKWSKIYVKNLKTGKKVAVSKSIKGNILYLKTSTRSSYTCYQVYIPYKAVKDASGNNLTNYRTWKFKTGTAATIVIDKGIKNVTDQKDLIYHVYNWTTYSYSNYHTKTVLTNTTYILGTPYWAIKNVIDIKKVSTNKLVVAETVTSASGKTTTYKHYFKYNGANAVKFYKYVFKEQLLKPYLR